jgi:acetyl-CoA carboxylase biotin carboxylase subunit
MFKKILIANRGEIALRIIRACRELGIQTVCVHSTADSQAKPVYLADESVCIGPGPSKDSYLNIPAILTAADITGVDAIHPGIGFLAENAAFAHMVEEHGYAFIGPVPDHIAKMGDKITAKTTMIELGVPVVPGSKGTVNTEEDALNAAKNIGFPLIIKATSGGGGKGMQVCNAMDEVLEKWKIARSEAKANFGNEEVYLERYLSKPRHIEIQIIGDGKGKVVHLGERDCSIQRRHQKIWEETPSPAISVEQRNTLGKTVCDALAHIHYRGVGTLEFLYENGEFFFIEMNTRLQVEHSITEMVTGIDLVKEQIRVAQGLPLSFSQEDIVLNGHSIECRINAEHHETFIPSPGKITAYHPPGGFGVRIDSHVYNGYQIPPFYDSLISKLIVHAKTREECLAKLDQAIREYVIDGVDTILPLHQKLLNEPDIKSGDYYIHWLEKKLKDGFTFKQ